MFFLFGFQDFDLERGTKPDINLADRHGYTALAKAAEKGDIEWITALVSKSADLNIINNYGYSPLGLAVLGNYVEAAKVLLESGSDVNQKQRGFETPLMLAAENSNLEMVQLLISFAANLNAKCTFGFTALVPMLQNFLSPSLTVCYNKLVFAMETT
jgi:ankyrin repeat protein